MEKRQRWREMKKREEERQRGRERKKCSKLQITSLRL